MTRRFSRCSDHAETLTPPGQRRSFVWHARRDANLVSSSDDFDCSENGPL